MTSAGTCTLETGGNQIHCRRSNRGSRVRGDRPGEWIVHTEAGVAPSDVDQVHPLTVVSAEEELVVSAGHQAIKVNLFKHVDGVSVAGQVVQHLVVVVEPGGDDDHAAVRAAVVLDGSEKVVKEGHQESGEVY